MKNILWMFLIFFSVTILSLPAEASSLWKCNVMVKATGPDSVVILKGEENIQGPCLDFKEGQSYTISPVLNPSDVYSFQIAVPEHMDMSDGANNKAQTQWILNPETERVKAAGESGESPEKEPSE